MIRQSSLPQSIFTRSAENDAAGLLPDNDKPGILLQTCNRAEFYEGDGKASSNVIRHLFRVVSGLESNLLGEIAIQGQVKAAYQEASAKYSLSKGLHRLFQTALFVGKKVRTESGISRGAVSHSQAVTEIIAQSGINLDKAIISLIGVHKLNEDIIRFLQAKGAETIFLANKSFEKAEPLGRKYGCTVMRFNQLKEMLQFTDVLISATSAPHLIVPFEKFPVNREMLIIDLAVPRDVDERIGELEGVKLFSLEHIERFVNQNISGRQLEIKHAEAIIEAEVQKFIARQETDFGLLTFPGAKNKFKGHSENLIGTRYKRAPASANQADPAQYGRVWLVGFGPGDPDLLTRKGYRLLQECDIIFYDDLINQEFLNEFSVEKVYVGKRKNKHSIEQEAINDLLLNAAVAGKNVVRLKGGDPMLFAHGGEEIGFLEQHSVKVEVVPGITAAMAVSASTQVPLTHRGISSSITFITGHSLESIDLPKSGTMVIYMGASNLSKIAYRALEIGWNPGTPVLLTSNVSNPSQEDEYTTLRDIIDFPKPYKTPLLIIIGDVVGLRNNVDVQAEIEQNKVLSGAYLNLGI